MYCEKCNSQIPTDAKFCPNCGEKIEIIDSYNTELDTNSESNISSSCTLAIVTSIISFILTTFIRFGVQEKSNLTPGAWTSHYGMVVPNNIKLFVLAIPAIFTLATVIGTIKSEQMNKKDKIISCIISAFSLLAAIAIVNLQIEL